MKTALAHDWLNQVGGAEDVLDIFVEMYPDAPVHTAFYLEEKMPDYYKSWDIRTSIIQKLPFTKNRQQPYLPLYPTAWEHFDFREFDVVISNKSGFCHGIVTGAETLHVCYCLTPTRYLWRYHQYADQENLSLPVRRILPPVLTYLRVWDRLAADRVDHFIAISEEVRRRIKKNYNRDSVIIYPPVDVNRFEPSTVTEDYYLMVGRLVPYRRLDLLIHAFNELGLPLKIGGKGRDLERLKSIANDNIEFLGFVPDEDLPDLFARAKAFMWTGEEDFGIAPIQAMAAGRPVIAYARGGALDTIIHGETGYLFEDQTVKGIKDAVTAFDPESVSPSFIRAHAEQFDVSVFKEKITRFVEEKLAEKQHNDGKPTSDNIY